MGYGEKLIFKGGLKIFQNGCMLCAHHKAVFSNFFLSITN